MILCLETATSLCSVALCDRNGSVFVEESEESRSHASRLTLLAEEVLGKAGISAKQLEAVAVSRGPGSYTGLRIGVSTAKGIAYGASIPLIGIDTTLSMYHGFLPLASVKYGSRMDDLFCPVLDARRMEVYYSVYNTSGCSVKNICATIVDSSFPGGLQSSVRIFIFGDAVAKCRQVISNENIVFDDEFRLSASFMTRAAYEAFDTQDFEDIAYFEPFYLKDFIATRPVKNILGQ